MDIASKFTDNVDLPLEKKHKKTWRRRKRKEESEGKEKNMFNTT